MTNFFTSIVFFWQLLESGLTVVALLAMVVVAGMTVYRLGGRVTMTLPAVWWHIPLLAVGGVVLTGYLVYLALRPETAVCMPVSDCQFLQQSRYAWPVEVPVGVWGLIVFLTTLLVWIGGQFGPDRWRAIVPWLLFGVTSVGELFSLYFTFLETFVIGAMCAWCLAAAVVMTILFWLSAEALNGVRMTRFL